jgi:transcriptional regulator with XRE-family HTH domain
VTTSTSAAALLIDARVRAGLTQRELAERAGTAQSVVARIEKRHVVPSLDTLSRLLAAAGFELRHELVLKPTEHSHMLEDCPRILHLSPEQRLAEVRNVNRFLFLARRG